MDNLRLHLKEIRRCIADDELAKARELLDLSKDAPQTFERLLLESDLSAKAGSTDRAETAIRAAIEVDKDNVRAWRRLMRLLMRRRDLIEARRIFRERIWNGDASQEEQDRLVVQLTSGADVEPGPALKFLEELDDAGPSQTVLCRKALFHSRQMEGEAASSLLERAAALGPLPPYADVLRAELLLNSGEASAALDVAQRLSAAKEGDARSAEIHVAAAASAGRLDLAAEALRSALSRHPADASLILRYNRVPFAPDDAAALFEIIAANAARHPLDPRALLQYAQACLEQDRFDEARSILSRLAEEPSVAAMAGPLAGALDFVAAAGPLPAPRIREDRGCEVAVAPCAGADTMLVAFAGLMGRFGYLPMSLLDCLLARYRTHVVYLRDTRDVAYLKGLSGLGASEDEAASGLRSMAADLGATRILTLGASLAGFAAIRYGAKLQADAVLSLGAPTQLGPELARQKAPAHVRRLFARASRRADVLDVLGAGPGPRVFYVYGADRESHRRQAARLERTPGVTLRPLPTDSALTAMDVMEQGKLFELLSDDLRLDLEP